MKQLRKPNVLWVGHKKTRKDVKGEFLERELTRADAMGFVVLLYTLVLQNTDNGRGFAPLILKFS